jgi:hypothetical protein
MGPWRAPARTRPKPRRPCFAGRRLAFVGDIQSRTLWAIAARTLFHCSSTPAHPAADSFAPREPAAAVACLAIADALAASPPRDASATLPLLLGGTELAFV